MIPSTHSWRGVIHHYGRRLQISTAVAPVTLYEGNTPLIPAPRLAKALGGQFELFLKFEGLNPTGSFKDRGMTTAVTQAVADGGRAVICASTGNTAASAAAYAGRAGLKCYVLVPEGKVAIGKLAGALAYGAKVISITGSFDDGLRMVREASEKAPIILVNSINPARMQGQKTASFEICDVLGEAPDWHCLPVGNAGNITADWMGYSEYFQDQVIKKRPQLLGVQAEGSAPIVHGKPVAKPETVATAIRIGNPARWQDAVPDAEILQAYHLVAETEGVFCEPSSATGLAGMRRGLAEGWLDLTGKKVVAVLTGHGLKDPDTAVQAVAAPITIKPDMDQLMELLAS
jgi:threonine synthase